MPLRGNHPTIVDYKLNFSYMGIKSKWLLLKDYLLDILIEKESYRLMKKGLLYRESSRLYSYDENTHQLVFRKVSYTAINDYDVSVADADIVVVRGCIGDKEVYRNVTYTYTDQCFGEDSSFNITKFEYLLELISIDIHGVRNIIKHV